MWEYFVNGVYVVYGVFVVNGVYVTVWPREFFVNVLVFTSLHWFLLL